MLIKNVMEDIIAASKLKLQISIMTNTKAITAFIPIILFNNRILFFSE
jgi:hypothetical protein